MNGLTGLVGRDSGDIMLWMVLCMAVSDWILAVPRLLKKGVKPKGASSVIIQTSKRIKKRQKAPSLATHLEDGITSYCSIEMPKMNSDTPSIIPIPVQFSCPCCQWPTILHVPSTILTQSFIDTPWYHNPKGKSSSSCHKTPKRHPKDGENIRRNSILFSNTWYEDPSSLFTPSLSSHSSA